MVFIFSVVKTLGGVINKDCLLVVNKSTCTLIMMILVAIFKAFYLHVWHITPKLFFIEYVTCTRSKRAQIVVVVADEKDGEEDA